MPSETLTSLAMLKVSIDQGRDYLDYLRPFILHILIEEKPDPVTDSAVCNHMRSLFGLEVPERAIQIVLKRISRNYPHDIEKETGVYQITGKLPNPEIMAEKSKAARHIQAVVAGLIEFSKSTAKPINNSEAAVIALLAFLSEFNVPCLRAYLRGTAIPTLDAKDESDIVLVSQYVLQLQQTNPERFESFLIMVQGHMLANALLCPDLQNAPRTYKGMSFYFDTPLLVRRLGLEGEHKKAAVKNLIDLLHNLGATVATFSHSRIELEGVIKGAADHIDSRDGRGAIVVEARRTGTTKSDLLLMATKIDDLLRAARLEVKNNPRYDRHFQIDEKAFEAVLDDEVSYFNPRAKENDINSVRSIYTLRARSAPSTLEKSKAVLVTSNSGFAQAAYQYGQRYEESREVSSVITDFGLANMAWLKAPMGAPSLPTTEVLAFSYAALQPSKELLNKYLAEIEKLQRQGKISERDHQLLRSSTSAQEELMRLTLGDEAALTDETVSEMLRRISEEIRKEPTERLAAEQEAHRKTREELASQRTEKQRIQERLFWRCNQKANLYSWIIAGFVAVLLLAGIAAGEGLKSSVPILGWILFICSSLLTLATILDIMVEFSVKNMRVKLEKRILTWLLKRESATSGVDLAQFQ